MTVAAQPLTGSYTCDPAHSSLHFAVRHMGVVWYRGSLDDVEAHLVADEHGARLDGLARVASLSIRTPDAFRAHVLDDPEFFHAPAHPELRFASDALALTGDGAATLDGRLTIKGIERPVTATGSYEAPVLDPYGNTRAGLHLRTMIDRRDWAMTWQASLPGGGEVLGWDVELTVDLALIRDAE